MITTVTGAVKRQLRARIGLWPLLEARNKVLLGRGALAWRRFEDAEVARLRQQAGPLPPALVAVVMPTYRRPEQLRAAVGSVLAQTVADLRLVVVDDGGGLPDGLPADERLTAVSLSRNSAVLGLVRNVGLRLTSSQFVAFLDDDNEWRPDHLEVALAALAERPRTRVVYTAVERRLSSGELLDTLSTPFDPRTFRDSSGYVDANSLVVRRDAGLHFSRLPRVRATLPKEDWEFLHRVARGGVVEHVPVPTVRYLVNADSYYTRWSDPAPDVTGSATA